MTEEWRSVVGYEGYYEVSDRGRVRSLDRMTGAPGTRYHKRGQLLKQTQRPSGYMQVTLGKMGRRQSILVHVMVLRAFSGDKSSPEIQGCHSDGEYSNNSLQNLRWGTPSENSYDMIRHGRHREARKTHCPRGHILAEPNLRAYKRKPHYRECLACSRAYSAARKLGMVLTKQFADPYYERIMNV